jgi:hypothetical protein
MVIIIQLAAEFQIQLSAELVDPLANMLGLQQQVFLVIKSDTVHKGPSPPKTKYLFII